MLAPTRDINWNSIFSSLNEEFEDSPKNIDTTAVASVNNLPVAHQDTPMSVNQNTESTLRVFILDPEQLKLTKQLVQNQDPRIVPAIAPALTFIALDITNVNLVILIGRLGPLLSLALAVLLLQERVNRLIVTGAVVSLIGVVLTIVLGPPSEPMMTMAGLPIGRGELLAVGGAIALAISTIISKATLGTIPLGILIIFRTALGTVFCGSLDSV